MNQPHHNTSNNSQLNLLTIIILLLTLGTLFTRNDNLNAQFSLYKLIRQLFNGNKFPLSQSFFISNTLEQIQLHIEKHHAEILKKSHPNAKTQQRKSIAKGINKQVAEKLKGNHIFNNPIHDLCQCLRQNIKKIEGNLDVTNMDEHMRLLIPILSHQKSIPLNASFKQHCLHLTVSDAELNRNNNIADANSIVFGLFAYDLKQQLSQFVHDITYGIGYVKKAWQRLHFITHIWKQLVHPSISIDSEALCYAHSKKPRAIQAALAEQKEFFLKSSQELMQLLFRLLDEAPIRNTGVSLSEQCAATDFFMEKSKDTLRLSCKQEEGSLQIICQHKEFPQYQSTFTYDRDSHEDISRTDNMTAQQQETHHALERYMEHNLINPAALMPRDDPSITTHSRTP